MKSNNEKKIKYMYLSILDNLCTSYKDQITDYYRKIIPLIISLLPDKEEISIESKRKIISCLRHIGDTLSNYMSIVIPKLTNYLMSLINKMKLIFYNRNSNNLVNNNQENLSESKFNYITNFFSSIFGINNIFF